METKREFIKKLSLVAAGGLVTGSGNNQEKFFMNVEAKDKNEVKNPYGGKPNGGISLPP